MVTSRDHREYSVIVGNIADEASFSTHLDHRKTSLPGSKKVRGVAIAYRSILNTHEVQSNSNARLVVQTFINYTKPYDQDVHLQAAVPDLKVTLRESVKKIVQISPITLQRQHELAWQSLWSSGFSISHSHAPDVVNGYQINSTLYYLLTQRRMSISHKFDSKANALQEIPLLADFENDSSKVVAYRPDRCYHGHSTLHVSIF